MPTVLEEIKQEIKSLLAAGFARAHEAGLLPAFEGEIYLEVPREKEHGDFASNVAMTSARQLKMPPRRIAETVVAHVDTAGSVVERLEVAGPGFINVFLNESWLYRAIRRALEEGERYGCTDAGRGRKVLVEFVSANPTGPMVVVQARAGALGDTLVNLFNMAGYCAKREFYINDSGNQVRNLGRSLDARYKQALGMDVPFPEDGYPGEYLIPMAQELVREEGDRLLSLDDEARIEFMASYAVRKNLEAQKRSLERYGVRFDIWSSQKALEESGALEHTLALLKQRGYTYEKDGALWFKSTAFGDDKDRVLVKSNGDVTYFAPDIAYHLNKYQRGFEELIDLLGPDHHGYIGRMRAAVQALGYPASSFEILIVQLVRLVSRGETIRMSKRGGTFITMDDLLDEVGRDAARFFFLMRAPDSPMDFDTDLAKVQGNENPVFYVQYAHARICSIFRQAEEVGLKMPSLDRVELSMLGDESELDLARKLAYWPHEVIDAARNREPHRITKYLLDLAQLFHTFYTRCRVIGEREDVSLARLALIKAVQITIASGLRALGVSAPDRM
ncbi:MAG: arginine--tRNA ligase [Bacillota bacterium]